MFLSLVCSGRVQSIKQYRFRFYLFFVLFHVTDALQMIEIAAQIAQKTFHLSFHFLCISQLRLHVCLFFVRLKHQLLGYITIFIILAFSDVQLFVSVGQESLALWLPIMWDIKNILPTGRSCAS